MVLSDNGTVKLNLGNGSTVINGDLSIKGTTVVLVSAPLTAHSLTLGGTTQGAGIWGGLNSGAGNINTTYFSAASPGDYITVTTGEGIVVTLPGQVFTPGVGNSGTVSNQTVGTAFNLTLYAVRPGGTVLDTNYSGIKTITYSGPATAPGGTAPSYTTNVTFINGVATNIATTLTAAETTTITASATDGTATGVASSSLTVVAISITMPSMLRHRKMPRGLSRHDHGARPVQQHGDGQCHADHPGQQHWRRNLWTPPTRSPDERCLYRQCELTVPPRRLTSRPPTPTARWAR